MGPVLGTFVFKKVSDWQWIVNHRGYFWSLSRTHLYIALVAVLLGLVVALPVGVLAARVPRAYGPILAVTTVLYSLPSLAVIAFLVGITGLNNNTVILPLAAYALAILVRSVTDGLNNVDDEVRVAATAMGYGPLRRLLSVELPAAVPVLIAGLRVSTVASISLVTVGSLIGIGGLGQLFTAGFNTDFITEIVAGIVIVAFWALVFDGLLLVSGRLLSPVGPADSVILASATSFSGVWSYLTSSAHWHGSGGFGQRLAQHFGYSLEAMLIAVAVAVPLGLISGHTGRGGAVLSLLSNASRALPTLGLLTVLALLVGVGLEAALIPLVVLAIPSILVNTYVGVRGVDRALVDAAYGMGLTPVQVLLRVEAPVALPLIVLGLRTAALQVVSTATIAAYVGLGGLGRYIIDGQASRNFAELGAGAIIVALFAIITEGLFLLAQRFLVSPGVRRRARTA